MNKSIYSAEQKYLVEKLRKARENSRLDQIEVGKLLGKTQSYISKIESGQRKINVIQLKEFAKIYKKDISYFVR